jgi:hypothetical protein
MGAMEALEVRRGQRLVQIEPDHFRTKRGVERADLEILEGGSRHGNALLGFLGDRGTGGEPGTSYAL